MNRENWIDVTRGIAILAVLIGHSGTIPTIHIYIYGFHMPLFFILSGYLFNYVKYFSMGVRRFVFKRAKMYVLPYFVFAIVNLMFNIPVELHNGTLHGSIAADVIYHFKWIFYCWPTTDRMPNCTPLWFLLALFISNVYCYFVLRYKHCMWLFIILSIVFNSWLIYCRYSFLPWNFDISMYGCIFMLLGYYIKQSNILKKRKLYMICILFLLSSICILYNGKINIGARIFQNELVMFFSSSVMSYTIMYLAKHYLSNVYWLKYLGKNTLYILAFNYVINTYSSGIWKRISIFENITYEWWMICIVDVLVSYLLIKLFNILNKKYPRMKILVGK